MNHDWTCYFLPTSSCQETLLKTGDKKQYVCYHQSTLSYYHHHSHSLGKLIPYPNFTTNDRKAIPDNYKHLGLSFW